eukprot:TRINITY_DN1537_c0_g1_i7.p1 TRINITY_DN1537_c0_g1~~TRINITY_DN1537_c0_g1_i7.p1  ORF type:complete len:216 (+),score=41.98 TRINITY_DN1537_c0_g1_i7:183-830(+)
MAAADPVEEYSLVTAAGETLKASRGYTGKGVATYVNGDKYDGDFVEGIREGKGKYVYAAGDEYEGDFKNNTKHGIGKMLYKPKGEPKGEYYGYWENGFRHGEGVFTYINKDIYSGQWRFGKKEGKGTYIFFETGMKYVGNWVDSNLVEGKWIFPNGTFFEGSFERNKPKGKGKWNFKNGDIVGGNYSQIIEGEDAEGQKLVKLGWKTTTEISEQL